MSAPKPAARPEQPPKMCGHCQVPDMSWHCANPQCDWAACKTCRKLTNLRGLIGRQPS